jgi:plasmid stabilization system protein ParE
MTPLTILHEAETELWEAVQFYESRCPGLGLDCENEIKAAIELIQQAPGRWAVRKDGTRRYLIHRFPYFVVYVVYNGHVWIVAFAHCKRKPGYWSARAKRAKSRRKQRRE